MQVFWKAWEIRHRREGKGLSWEDGEGGFQGASCVPHVKGHGFRSEQRDGLKRRTHWQLLPRSLTPDPYTIFRLSAQDVRVSLPESVFVAALSWLSTVRLLFTLPHLLRKCPPWPAETGWEWAQKQRAHTAAWQPGWEGSWGKWIHEYVWLSRSAVPLNLSGHCESDIRQHKIKSL